MAQRFIRLPVVLRRYGISKTTIYDLIAKSKFPKPIHVGRSALWSVQEFDRFDQAKLEERDLGQL